MDIKVIKIDFDAYMEHDNIEESYNEAIRRVIKYFNRSTLPTSDIKITEDGYLMLKIHTDIAMYMNELHAVGAVYLMPGLPGKAPMLISSLLNQIIVPIIDPDKTIETGKPSFIEYTLIINIPPLEYLRRHYNDVNNSAAELYPITMATEKDNVGKIKRMLRTQPYVIDEDNYSYILIKLDRRRDYSMHNCLADIYQLCVENNIPIIGKSLPKDEVEA